MKKLSLFLLTFYLFSCSGEKNYDTEIFESLQKLEANKVMMDVEVDGKKFYAHKKAYTGSITINEASCLLEFNGDASENLKVRIDGKGWSKLPSKIFTFQNSEPLSNGVQASVLIGRKYEGQNEGYIMTDGSIEIKQLNQEACIVVLHGLLSSSQNKVVKPINGLVVFKKPAALPFDSPKKDLYF